MNPAQTRPSSPRRHTAWFVWLGMALVAVMVLGASKSLQSPGDAPTSAGSTSDELQAGGFGFVDVLGKVTDMYPLQPGRVVQVMAQDGDEVEKDAPLFRLDDTVARIDVERAQFAVKEAELQLRIAEIKVEQYQAAWDAQKHGVEAKQNRVKIAESQVKESERLFKAGQLGAEKVEQAKDAVKAFTAEAAAEQDKETALAKGAEEPELATERAKNDVADKKQLLKKAQFGLDECTVKAPAKGQVLRMLVAVGDPLSAMPRQPAVQFAIDGPRIIRAEIDQEFASRVKQGQAAEVQDDVRASKAWSGTVRRVSTWYTHRRSILQEPLQFNDVRTLEVIIELDNPPKDLKIGQKVRVTLK